MNHNANLLTNPTAVSILSSLAASVAFASHCRTHAIPAGPSAQTSRMLWRSSTELLADRYVPLVHRHTYTRCNRGVLAALLRLGRRSIHSNF